MLEKKDDRNHICLIRLAHAAWWLMALGLMLVVSGPLVHADTPVGGPIVSDTTWTLSNSPYIVVESVDVWAGVTLTIEPGVTVRFNSNKKLQINGTLVAQGTEGQPITFTSNETGPEPGDWANIEFTDTSADATYDGAGNYIGGCVLQHCVVEYGGSDVNGAVEIADASPYVDHCAVRSNLSSGIHALGVAVSPVVISNNVVSENGDRGPWLPTEHGGGIYAIHARVIGNAVDDNYAFSGGGGIYVDEAIVEENSVTGNAVSRNGGGIRVASYGIATLTGNTVLANRANDGAGIDIGYHATTTAEGNHVVGNAADRFGGGIYGSYSTATVVRNVIQDNSSAYKGGGVYTYHGTVEVAENIVTGNAADQEGGGIQAWEGATVTGNTIVGNKLLTPGYGSGLHFCGTGDVMHNTIVGNNGIASESTTGGVEIASQCGSPAFHYNNLYENFPYDVTVRGSEDVDGTFNYWGTTDGLAILAQVYDWYDDSSRGRLLYLPYLDDPDPDAPVPPPLNLTGDWRGGAFALDWDPIPSTTTGYGYKVYYDTDGPAPPYEGTGLDQGASPIDVGDLTEYTLTGLDPNATHYAAVTAYDTLGREGWYSNVINSLRRVYLPLILKSF